MNDLLLSYIESLSFVINKCLFFDCPIKYWFILKLEEEIMNVLMATLISFMQVHVLRCWLQKQNANDTFKQNILFSLSL